MSSIVYQTDKKTGAKYAYESVFYWDKEKKQPRLKRQYIGRADPDTGETISKGGRAGSKPQPPASDSILRESLLPKNKEIAALLEEVSSLKQENKRLTQLLAQIQQLARERRVAREKFPGYFLAF